jgi:2-amino-4-hydroxy-6-hydroxymethyldihydropteridine diphosphokinase
LKRVTAYVGVGSNLEGPRDQVLAAFSALDRLPETRLAARSSLYRSAPLGYGAQPDFVNAVAKIETALDPGRLLAELQAIEARHARRRSFPDAPRTLDLDLLLYGDEAIDTPVLSVPHPRMHERAFVLAPLAEIDPRATVPGRGTVSELLARCAGQRIEKLPA